MQKRLVSQKCGSLMLAPEVSALGSDPRLRPAPSLSAVYAVPSSSFSPLAIVLAQERAITVMNAECALNYFALFGVKKPGSL